ncbi:MAG: homoserine kinase [Pseudomonadota bacterium]
MSARAIARAFAPASVGNVAVGFDILGHALEHVGDTVTAARTAAPGVRIEAVAGLDRALPVDHTRNTAGVAVQSLLDATGAGFGVALRIDKGVPLSSGMGGSAASAVAAAVAANALLDAPLDTAALLPHCVAGEAVASGSLHGDNVAPSLLGGLVLVGLGAQPTAQTIAVPAGLRCVLLHPHRNLDTRAGRALLKADYPLRDVVAQTSRLATVLAACFTGERERLRGALEDVLVEPQRAGQLPGFAAIKTAALDAGAYGCSLSGSGPSLFAWCDAHQADGVSAAMAAACDATGCASDRYVSRIDAPGARLVDADAVAVGGA